MFTTHAQKRLLRSFRSKIWPRHSLWLLRVPIRQMYFHYRVTFTGYIRCFCATTSHDFVTLTFDLLTIRVVRVQRFSCRPTTTYQFLLSYGYRLLSYELLHLITFALPVTVIAHAPCQVTCHRRATMVHISEIHVLNSPIHFVTFRSLRRRLSHAMAKMHLSHCEGYIVHCECAVSRDLCIAGTPKGHVTIFGPELSIAYENFYGAMPTIKVVLYCSIPMLKRFSAAKSPVNICPKMAVFGNLRV